MAPDKGTMGVPTHCEWIWRLPCSLPLCCGHARSNHSSEGAGSTVNSRLDSVTPKAKSSPRLQTRVLGTPSRSSGYDVALALPGPRFNPRLGN